MSYIGAKTQGWSLLVTGWSGWVRKACLTLWSLYRLEGVYWA